MRMIRPEEQTREIEFALEAAEWFNDHPGHMTYADGNPEAGKFLALRWGLDNDCVVIVLLDEYFEPINYQNIIRTKQTSRVCSHGFRVCSECEMERFEFK